MLLLFQACLEELVAKPVKFQIQTVVFLDQFYGSGIDLWAGFRNLAVFIEWDFPVECQGREHEAFFKPLANSDDAKRLQVLLSQLQRALGAFVGSHSGDHSALQVLTMRGQTKEIFDSKLLAFHLAMQRVKRTTL